VEYTTGAPSWRLVLRRALGGLRPRRKNQRQRGWSVAVPLIGLAAGLLFTTSATTADGTALRDDRRPQLTQLIADKRTRLEHREERAASLRKAVDEDAAKLANVDEPVKQARERADALRGGAGFTALHGPGITVNLNDSPQRTTGGGTDAPENDDLVVHQGDVQAVVNALWRDLHERGTLCRQHAAAPRPSLLPAIQDHGDRRTHSDASRVGVRRGSPTIPCGGGRFRPRLSGNRREERDCAGVRRVE